MLQKKGVEGCVGVQSGERREQCAGLVLPGPDLVPGRFNSCKSIGAHLYSSWSHGKVGPWPRAARGPGWEHHEKEGLCLDAALTCLLPSCLLRVGGPERSNSVLIFPSLTSPSWTPATLTLPPASGSCSGARRAARLNPASTALKTQSSSRYGLSLPPPLLKAWLRPARLLLHLLLQRSLLFQLSSQDPASRPGSALDLGQFSAPCRTCSRLWTVGAGRSCSCYTTLSEVSPTVGRGGFKTSLSYSISPNSQPYPGRQV